MDKKNNPWRVELTETPPNEMEKYSLYSDYTTEQKAGFIALIRMIYECIQELQEYGEITENVKIMARIKSAESAIKNDDKEDKALDDVFGMEIVAGNDTALNKIMKKIEAYMNILREKKHNKENGYKATHRVMEIKKECKDRLKLGEGIELEQIPMIEIQFKTFEVKENCISGPARHSEYKDESPEKIQRMYDNNELTEHNLPIMYTIDNTGTIRILNKIATIREVYPFVRLHSKGKGEQR